jgi:hypothetical protein
MRWDRPEALSQAERLKLKRLALNALTFGPCWVNLVEVSKHVDLEAADWRTRVRNPPPPPNARTIQAVRDHRRPVISLSAAIFYKTPNSPN